MASTQVPDDIMNYYCHAQSSNRAHRHYAIHEQTKNSGIPASKSCVNLHVQSLSPPQSPQSLADSQTSDWNSWWHTETANTAGPYSYDRHMGPQDAVSRGTGTGPAKPRRDSGSSVSSTTSASTPTADCAYSWSPSTTPESTSPTSPNNRDLLTQLHHPERMSSKMAYVSSVMVSPSRVSQDQMPSRVIRPNYPVTRSISKRFPNTPIEVAVPEEEVSHEHHRRPVRPELRLIVQNETAASSASSASSVSSTASATLHQRRQQRHQKLATYSPFPQTSHTKLSPLPLLPIQQCQQQQRIPSSPLSATLPRKPISKEATRSLPQLRDFVSLPPECLPPLPPVPQLSPMFPASPVTAAAPRSPATLAALHDLPPLPASPSLPPPPPPPKPQRQSKLQATSDRWEEELRRHKQLLRHFPQKPEQLGERLKVSRTHKSLGNLRARSRAHSTPPTCDIVTTSSGIVCASSAGRSRLRGLKHAKSKSMWETSSPREGVRPDATPHVSVFEDDSDDEGDTVRQFVRNLFTRRTKSSEMTPMSGSHSHERSGVCPSSASAAGHHSRKKNHSTSSSLSTTATPGTTTAANSSDPGSGMDADSHSDLSRTSGDNSRQRSPLLARMFVRRSH